MPTKPAMPSKFLLDESQLPTHWYNLVADLPTPPAPYLHPATREPVGPADLAPLFPMALIGQEVTTERYVPIPEEVREVYRLWRPSPLYRAHRLERALGTPARIYYKVRRRVRLEALPPGNDRDVRRKRASQSVGSDSVGT
jgi:tryptophan synthase beta chain